MLTDADALTCDMAETYSVYNMRALPVFTAATLACGLRDDSRVKRHLFDVKVPLELQLQIGIFDLLRWIQWSKTKSAETGDDYPEPLLAKVLGIDKDQTDQTVTAFDSAEEFEKRRKELLKGV